jgi:hypothetical protein
MRVSVGLIELAVVEARGESGKGEGPRVALRTQCDTGKDFFIWIRRNPLKSPDSDE